LPSGISGGTGRGGTGRRRSAAGGVVTGKGQWGRRRLFFHVVYRFMDVVMIISKASFDS
jgi:hypothetical protein